MADGGGARGILKPQLFCILFLACRGPGRAGIADAFGRACGLDVMRPASGQSSGAGRHVPLRVAHVVGRRLPYARPFLQQPAEPSAGHQGEMMTVDVA